MKRRTCAYEGAVSRAARTDRWDEALRVHVASCGVCRDIVAVTRALQTLAWTPTSADVRRPDPGLIWWKAQLLKDLAITPPRVGTLFYLQDFLQYAVYFFLAAPWVIGLGLYGPTWQSEFVRLWMTHVEGLDFPFAEAIWRSLALTVWGLGLSLLGIALAWTLGCFPTEDR
ncbi:MAG: hypothetical protein NZ742_09730 [Acidobacteria bacterium]|nr:hypothetical protein [Acidobacteriota bacterium]MDW7985051.1 hypothetical protein [Acidobacteriota bacterium]